MLNNPNDISLDSNVNRSNFVIVSRNFIQNEMKSFKTFKHESTPHISSPLSQLTIRTSIRRRYGQRTINGMNIIWRRKAFQIVILITRFLSLIQTHSERYRLRTLPKRIFGLIEDLSSDYQSLQEMGYIRKPRNSKLKAFFSKCAATLTFNPAAGVLEPDGYIFLSWQFLQMTLIFLLILFVPLEIGFYHDIEDLNQKFVIIASITAIINFLLDILMKLNTAYFQKGILVKDRRLIFKYQIWQIMMLDVPVVTGFFLGILGYYQMHMLIFLKVKEMNQILENFEEISLARLKYASAIDLVKLIVFVIFVSHSLACLWHLVSVTEISLSVELNWVSKLGLQYAGFQERYITSLYWSIITLTTVGYGDVIPVNQYERAFVSFSVLLSSITFGYILSSIQNIFIQMQEVSDKFKKKRNSINYFIKRYRLNKSLGSKIRRYFEYYYQQVNVSTIIILEEGEDDFLNIMSQELRCEVNKQIYKDILNNSLGLRHLGEEVINTLCQKVNIKHFLPGETIFKQDRPCNKLFFILKGQLSTYVKLNAEDDDQNDQGQKNKNLKVSGDGEIFEEKNFLQEERFDYSAKANTFCEMGSIDYDEFLQVIYSKLETKEKYFQLKENLKFNPKLKSIKHVCQVCYLNHPFMKCPYAFFNADWVNTQSEDTQDYPNSTSRVAFDRKFISNRHHALQLKTYQMQVLDLALEYQFLSEQDLDESLIKQFGIALDPQGQQSFIQVPVNPDSPSYLDFGDNHFSFKAASVRNFELKICDRVRSQYMTKFSDPKNSPLHSPTSSMPGSSRISNKKVFYQNHLKQSSIVNTPQSKLQFKTIPRISQTRLSQVGVKPKLSQASALYWDFLKKLTDDGVEGFDKYFEYSHYYPHYNLSEVLRKLTKNKEKRNRFTLKKPFDLIKRKTTNN